MFALLTVAAHAAPDVDESVAPMRDGETRRLRPASTPGAFRLEYVGQVAWTAAPAPATVELTEGLWGAPVARAEVDALGRFRLTAEVIPGTWTIGSQVGDASAPYRDSIGPRLHVSPDGTATCVSNCSGVCHSVSFDATTLGHGEQTAQPRPTITWEPLPDAATYRVRWFEKDAAGRVLATVQNIPAAAPSWTFDRDLPPGRELEWQVEAVAAAPLRGGACAGRELGGAGGVFVTPGFARAAPSPAPPPGGGFLGVHLRTEGPPFRDPGHERVVITDLVPRAPGVYAGLLPGDVVVEVDGAPVQRAEDAVARIAEHAPGDRLSLVIERDGRARPVTVALAARP